MITQMVGNFTTPSIPCRGEFLKMRLDCPTSMIITSGGECPKSVWYCPRPGLRSDFSKYLGDQPECHALWRVGSATCGPDGKLHGQQCHGAYERDHDDAQKLGKEKRSGDF